MGSDTPTCISSVRGNCQLLVLMTHLKPTCCQFMQSTRSPWEYKIILKSPSPKPYIQRQDNQTNATPSTFTKAPESIFYNNTSQAEQLCQCTGICSMHACIHYVRAYTSSEIAQTHSTWGAVMSRICCSNCCNIADLLTCDDQGTHLNI